MSEKTMNINFNNGSDEELLEIVTQICIKSKISDEESVEKVINWIKQIAVDVALVSLILEDHVVIDGCEDDGEFFFALTKNTNEPNIEQPNSKIWDQISQIINEKDGKNFQN